MTALTELDYVAHRAEREAVLAAAAGDVRVAAVHEELSLRYAARFLRALADRAGRRSMLVPPPASRRPAG